ncbi:MAG: hypothetical protein U1E49_09825 [Hyphomicrobiaceae bacterium]
MTGRVCIGFDARIRPGSRSDLPAPLIGGRTFLSADPSVWLPPQALADQWNGPIPDWGNSLGLAKDVHALRPFPTGPDDCLVALTASKHVVATEIQRAGPGYFDVIRSERELLADGWTLVGFDALDTSGLISGLHGCGFAEPSLLYFQHHFWPQLNEACLFETDRDAAAFGAYRGVEIREHAPFVEVGVCVKSPAIQEW